MKFSLKALIWLTILLAAVLAGVFAWMPQPVEVELATATEGRLRVFVEEDGKTRIREKYIVSAPVTGRLSRIELDSGDEVAATNTLLAVILPSAPAMLDARSKAEAVARMEAAQASVDRSQSQTEQAKIDLELARENFDRAQRLITENAISQNEYDTFKAQHKAAQQAIATAEFESEIANFELKMARAAADQFNQSEAENILEPFPIESPISGKVLRVFQESATVVTVGTPLLELGDPKNLEIEVDVLSTDAVQIEPGAELTIKHWGGKSPLKGTVRVVEPAAFTKISSLGVEEQRVNIIADFNEPLERLKTLGDEYRIEARIVVDEIDQALLIPNSALFRHSGEWHVLVAKEGVARLQQVEIGLQNDSQTQILGGLSAGDRVIVYPSDEVRDGTAITTVE